MTAGNLPSETAFPRLGRIVAVTGARAMLLLDMDEDGRPGRSPEIGALLGMDGPHGAVLGIVSSASAPAPSTSGESELRMVEMDLVGELLTAGPFLRGVRNYPALGDIVRLATRDELLRTYTDSRSGDSIRIGTIHQDQTIPAMVGIDDLLGKHFAVLGSTGTGKSCATALILQRILEKAPHAHTLLLDVHREYATAFKSRAEVLSPETMQLPYWLLTLEEIVEVLLVDEPQREAEAEFLRDFIPVAKQRHVLNARRGDRRDLPVFSVDAPVPYRMSDVTAQIDEVLGKIEHRSEHTALKRLKARIETVSRDPRYAFMFGSLTVQDTMVQLLARLFRVPVQGKPVTIVELGGLPSEVISVVVSVLARLAFDFGVWSGGKVPLTLICEEAHRYAPAGNTTTFEPVKRALSRIAREGRKYGISLAVITQRPAELDPTILSQCSTIFALRLSNARDQDIIQASVPETAAGLMDFIPVLGTAEAIAFGEGLSLPGRILLDQLPADALPTSDTSSFVKAWSDDVVGESFLNDLVQRWRAQEHISGADATQAALTVAQEAAAALLPATPQQRITERRRETALPDPIRAASPAQGSFDSLLKQLRERI